MTNRFRIVAGAVTLLAACIWIWLAPSMGRTGEQHFGKPDRPSVEVAAPAQTPPMAQPRITAPEPQREQAPPTSGPIPVSQAEFGEAWPFKPPITYGAVDCIEGSHSIFIADGKRYALSGNARNGPSLQQLGLVDFQTIWRDNPAPGYEGTKINIGPMIDLARKRCAL